jgi:hypothetical protein
MDNKEKIRLAINQISVNNCDGSANEESIKAIRYLQEVSEALTIPVVSNNEVALKAFVKEYIEAWEDGMGGDTDLYRKAKSLL